MIEMKDLLFVADCDAEDQSRRDTQPIRVRSRDTVPILEPPFFELDAVIGRARCSPDPWFAGVLADLWRQEYTGVLKVSAKGVDTIIYFDSGVPVHVEGASGPALHGEEQLIACFAPTQLEYSVRAGEEELEYIPQRKMSPARLLFEGIHRHYGPERLAEILDIRLRRYPSLKGDLESAARELRLSPDERAFLKNLDGTRVVSIVQACSNLDAHRAGQFLAALVLAGKLEMRLMPPRSVAVRSTGEFERVDVVEVHTPRRQREWEPCLDV